MILRGLQKELLQASEKYPVIIVLGPRQSGKTTLIKEAFPEKTYYSLENPDVCLSAEIDTENFLNTLPNGAILDEIQHHPELLRHIIKIKDTLNQKKVFIFAAGHNQVMHPSTSKDLADNCSILTLLPFSLRELRYYRKKPEPLELIVNGSFPIIYEKNLNPGDFFNNYLQTYLEKDVPALINFKVPNVLFLSLIRLLASQIGQVINYTLLSKEIGVSAITIKKWIKVLEASFIIFELPPFFPNTRKRVIKSPKLYFYDTGLAASLIGIQTQAQVLRMPFYEKLYENLIITEILKAYLNAGQYPDFFFYKDTHENEVDLIVRHDDNLIPININSSAIFRDDFHKPIEHFQKITGKRCTDGYVLYNGSETFSLRRTKIFNLIAS